MDGLTPILCWTLGESTIIFGTCTSFRKTLSQNVFVGAGTNGLSSGESEFYACVKGGASLLGMRSLMLDWGICPKLTLKIRTDSSAAKGFATRRGLGRQRHVSTRFLWLQDKVSKGELKVVKVGTADQLADFLRLPDG